MAQRKSGVLAHITMLPSEYGIGDIGPTAYEFAEYLLNSGQTIWQILPTKPTEMGCGNSPLPRLPGYYPATTTFNLRLLLLFLLLLRLYGIMI